jgi:hypothetical protein
VILIAQRLREKSKTDPNVKRHQSKLVRGLLCNGCNTGIGMLQDNPAIVDMAAAYLRAKL